MILCDDLKHELMQPDKNQVQLPAGVSKVHLPIPLEVTRPALGVYIRLHRRQGEHRVLQETEFLQWMERLVELRARPGLQGPIFFLWGTDHEDQPIVNAQRLRSTDPRMFLDWKALLEAQSRLKNSGSLLSFFSSSVSPGTASRARGASVEEQRQEDHCSARNRGGGGGGAREANRGGGREGAAGEGSHGEDVQSLHSHSSTQVGTLTPKRSNTRELADDAPQGAEEQRKQQRTLLRPSLSLSEQRVKEISEREKRVQELSYGHTSTANHGQHK